MATCSPLGPAFARWSAILTQKTRKVWREITCKKQWTILFLSQKRHQEYRRMQRQSSIELIINPAVLKSASQTWLPSLEANGQLIAAWPRRRWIRPFRCANSTPGWSFPKRSASHWKGRTVITIIQKLTSYTRKIVNFRRLEIQDYSFVVEKWKRRLTFMMKFSLLRTRGFFTFCRGKNQSQLHSIQVQFHYCILNDILVMINDDNI